MTPTCGRSTECFSTALAAVVATLSVAVAVPLAGGVRLPLLRCMKLQVGPFVTNGVTVHWSCTAELKPFLEPTVIVEMADTPAGPEVAERGPFATVKSALETSVAYFATKPSVLPP